MPQIAVGSTVVPIQNPMNGPGINGVNMGNSPIYVGPDPTVNRNSASQTLEQGDVLNWPANEALFVVCDPGDVSIFQYSNNGASITKGTVNTKILSGSVDIAGDVNLAGPVELAAGAEVNATITNATIDVAGNVVNQAASLPTLIASKSWVIPTGVTGVHNLGANLIVGGCANFSSVLLVVSFADATGTYTAVNVQNVSHFLVEGIGSLGQYQPSFYIMGGSTGTTPNGLFQFPVSAAGYIVVPYVNLGTAITQNITITVSAYGVASAIDKVKYANLGPLLNSGLGYNGIAFSNFNGTNVVIPLDSRSGPLSVGLTMISGSSATIDVFGAYGGPLGGPTGSNDPILVQTTSTVGFSYIYINTIAPTVPLYIVATGNGRIALSQEMF